MGGVVAVLCFCLVALWVVQRDRVLPNTVVAGVDVGGVSSDEARSRLQPVVERRADDALMLELETPDDLVEVELHPSAVDYRIDLDRTVAAAMARGREGLPGDIIERLRAFRATEEVPLAHDEAALRLDEWLAELADELDRPEARGDVTVDPETLEVRREPSHGRVEVDRAELAGRTRAALLGDRSSGPVAIPAETTAQPIADRDLDEVLAQVERALDGDLQLSAEGETLTLAPEQLAGLLDVVEATGGQTGTSLELVVTPAAVDEVVGEDAGGRFDVDPVDASYATSRTPPRGFDPQGAATFTPVEVDVGVEEGRPGRRFDAERAATQLTELLRVGAREAGLDLAPIAPGFDAEAARELRPSHMIGTFTTYYTAGQTRNRNIQRLADVIDNTLLLPGAQFSINDISGPRTCDRGYFPAGTIVAGELVDTCGGGTSQFGTTTFNAAFFAGVQLDDWKAHSWYISRYPMGREATLTYPYLDVKFTNNTPGAVVVRASHTASSVTVTIYGQPRATAVHATLGSPSNPRSFDTEVRTTSDLQQGQERVLQSGANGFRVQVVRRIELAGGGEESQTITTTYVPQKRIVERGTRPPPDAEPDEDDNPDDAGPED